MPKHAKTEHGMRLPLSKHAKEIFARSYRTEGSTVTGKRAKELARIANESESRVVRWFKEERR